MADENQKKPKLVFDVMPGGGQQHAEPQDMPENNQTEQDQPAQVPPELTQAPAKSHSRIPTKYLLISLGIVILGVGGYFGYTWYADNYLQEEETVNTPPPQPTLPAAFMTKYFNSAVCENESTCGPNADPDNDGLTNLRESNLGTSPLNVDSDHDGLADNDEIRIYETDPIVADSDGDGFEDGAEVRNKFSPKVASANPASSIELQIIEENKQTYPLHPSTQEFLAFTSFTTRFGAEEASAAGLTIGLSDTWTLDEGTINPLIFMGISTSTTLVLSKSTVSATSTTASLVEAAVTASKTQYPSLQELGEDIYMISESDVSRKSFSFTDGGRAYKMEVVYVRSGATLVQAAIIATDMAFVNIETQADVMLTSVRIVE